jgi:DNA polymerase-4
MDAFFAAVEIVQNPALKGKPLIIGGTKEDLRGVVSTASYEARRFGVHSAMPIAQALKLCPHGIFMRGHFELYREASATVRRVLETVSPLVQMASIDEAYVDVTGSQKLFGGDDAIGAYIRDTIRQETQLPCTVAITPNKLVSKIASDEAKPDGYIRVDAGNEAAYLAPLAVRKLPGAGPRTCTVLESLGIMTLGQLAATPLSMLESVFGDQMAVTLQRAAQGISVSHVEVDRTPKSISRETTFDRDLLDWNRIEQVLAYLTERAAHALREEGMEAKRVTLKVKYGDFQLRTFARTLPEPTCLDRDIAAVLSELVPKARDRRARVRLIGVNLGQLSYNQHQMGLFNRAGTEKWERVLKSLDGVRGKHGFESMHFGRALGARPKKTLTSL